MTENKLIPQSNSQYLPPVPDLDPYYCLSSSLLFLQRYEPTIRASSSNWRRNSKCKRRTQLKLIHKTYKKLKLVQSITCYPQSFNMASNNEELQLVPEAILKRKHDMDDMRAHRAAQQIINPRGNRKIFSQKTKVIKIHKPETILAMARSKRNHSIRYNRVLRKGMQKRASKSKLEKTKIVVPDGVTNAEEEEELQREVSFVSNSVGAKMVFVVRIREPNGMPKKVKKILNGMKLKSSNEVCCCFMFIIGDRSCKL